MHKYFNAYYNLNVFYYNCVRMFCFKSIVYFRDMSFLFRRRISYVCTKLFLLNKLLIFIACRSFYHAFADKRMWDKRLDNFDELRKLKRFRAFKLFVDWYFKSFSEIINYLNFHTNVRGKISFIKVYKAPFPQIP